VIDVTHDGHDRRARSEILDVILFGFAHRLGFVFGLTHRTETEFARDQLDLVEVKTLVDGHHEAEILERERDDLGRGNFQNLRKLADGDELIDVNSLPFALGFGGPRRLEIFARSAP
jgi:hypothetical protein